MDNGTGVVPQLRNSVGCARSAAINGSRFIVVWLGCSLDAAHSGLYSLVLRPAVTELLGGHPTMAQLGSVGGLLSMVAGCSAGPSAAFCSAP